MKVKLDRVGFKGSSGARVTQRGILFSASKRVTALLSIACIGTLHRNLFENQDTKLKDF